MSSPAHADFFIHSWDDRHTSAHLLDAGTDLIWYHTSSNFDSNGSSFAPLGLNSYQRVLLDLNGSYGLTSKLSLYLRLNWEMSKVDSSSTLAFTGTSYGVGDQSVGLNYRVLEKPHGLALDLQGQLDFPLYTNNTYTLSGSQNTSAPTLGDASVDATFGAFLTFPLSEGSNADIRLLGGGGYTYRSNSFSAQIPWSAMLQRLPRAEGLVASVGAYGEQSLNTDSHSNNATFLNTSSGSLGTGGSYITNAINPSLVNLRAEAGYRTRDDLQFTGAFAQSVWGREAPNGFSLTFAFQTHFGGTESEPSNDDPVFQSRVKYGHSNKGFVNYNLEAKVLRANDRFNMVKIDKGADQGVRKGDVFDIFTVNPDGELGSAIARGHVAAVKPGESAVKIDEYFKEVWIEEGFVARRPVD
jgi:hypothetical protein